MIIYAGGTTGMPKGVMWRHEDPGLRRYVCGNEGGQLHDRRRGVSADPCAGYGQVRHEVSGAMAILAIDPLPETSCISTHRQTASARKQASQPALPAGAPHPDDYPTASLTNATTFSSGASASITVPSGLIRSKRVRVSLEYSTTQLPSTFT